MDKVQYKPPRKIGQRNSTGERAARAAHAKLWIVYLVDYYFIPDSEIERYEEGERRALDLIKDSAQSKATSFHWSHKPKMANELETGDWIIQCIRHKDKSITVWPPAQLLFIDHYIRDSESGKERYVFHLELPKRGQTLKWPEFQQRALPILSNGVGQPRTKPIRDTTEADDLLSLWTPSGRIARR
jgi:hypothetical protein